MAYKLLLYSVDQTTRIHGQVQPGDTKSWHEISRPQVHGYDLLDAAFLDPLKFVSIADEKVARVFEAPREFVDTVQNLRVAEFSTDVVSSSSIYRVCVLNIKTVRKAACCYGSSLGAVKQSCQRRYVSSSQRIIMVLMTIYVSGGGHLI